jgi:hypothetical protein
MFSIISPPLAVVRIWRVVATEIAKRNEVARRMIEGNVEKSVGSRK